MSTLLSSPGSSGSPATEAVRQSIQIANFPPHWIERIEPSKEWLIYNDNVTIVSCGPQGLGPYDDRGFITDQTAGLYPGAHEP